MTDCYFLGTDEAGYGPNLGPLVVSATCWKMTLDDVAFSKRGDSAPHPASLFDALEEELSSNPSNPDTENDLVDDYSRFPSDRGIAELNLRLAGLCASDGIFPVIDSKRLYHSGHIAPLERSFFLALRMSTDHLGANPIFDKACRDASADGKTSRAFSFCSVIDSLRSTAGWNRGDLNKGSQMQGESVGLAPPWELNVDFPLPVAPLGKKDGDFDVDLHRVEEAFQTADISLLGIRSRRVQPEEFNRLLDQCGLKSELLAEVTFSTVLEFIDTVRRRLVDARPDDRIGAKTSKATDSPARRGMATPSKSTAIILLCDKLGGRNRYGDLLARFFPDISFRTVNESRPLSVYRAQIDGSLTMEVRFQAKGEKNLPTALASIASKYLREISMIPLNGYWRQRVPNLRPTAGYPLDAKRFRAETEQVRAEMKLPDSLFWRNK